LSIRPVKRFRIAGERFRDPLGTHHTSTAIVAGLVNIEAGSGRSDRAARN
jgi:hypothetical protein